MHCGDDLQESAGGSFHSIMQDTNGGRLVTWVVTWDSNNKASGGDLEARDGTVKVSPCNGVCTEAGIIFGLLDQRIEKLPFTFSLFPNSSI